MLPTALLVDLDGVICHWSSDHSRIETAFGLPVGAMLRVAFAPELLVPAITGAISDESWRVNIATELRRLYPASQAGEAVAAWSAYPGEVSSDVLAVLARCRPELRIVLATNATSRLTADLRMLGLDSRFHAVANSSDLRVAKPQAEFYAGALQLAGAGAAEALFVDDSLSNVTAAARFGILSHHFRDHTALLKFLEQAGAIRGNAL